MSSNPDYREVFDQVMGEGRIDMYGDEAALFDIVYSQGKMSQYKESAARRNIAEDSDVLDLACGTGISTALIDEEYNATGADLSGDMLEIAKKKDLEADFVQSDMRDLPFEQEFDAVIMYGQPFSHLESPSDVKDAAESIHSALNENGVLLTDFFPPEGGRIDRMGPVETEFDENHRASMVADFSDYDPENQSWKGKITFWLESRGFTTNVSDREREMRGYSLEEMEDIIGEAGFSDFEEEKIYPGNFYNSIRAVK